MTSSGTLCGDPVEWYFRQLESDPDELGMLMGNLRIAEDRVLSYAPLLKHENPAEE